MKNISRAGYWGRLVLDMYVFVVKITYYSGMLVAATRMFGYRMRRNVYKPFSATSFRQIVPRTMYYYGEMIKKYFFFPLYRRCTFIKSMRTRLFVVTFLSVFMSAIVFHFFRYLGLSLGTDDLLFYRIVSSSLYYFLLSLGISISTVKSVTLPAKQDRRNYVGAVRILGLYIAIMLFAVIPKYFNTSVSETMNIVFYMLGLSVSI
ncbi:MAG: hypothetical protein IPJ84_03195 [Bdellovibrionales bacterium]|nr:hypothetical protein [Bdellovibrionales bacterium]